MREFWFGCGTDKLPEEWRGAYELVVASGVFVEGHIPPSGFDDAYEMLKPGGFFVTALREKYFKEGNEWGYDRKLEELCAAEKFEIMKT